MNTINYVFYIHELSYHLCMCLRSICSPKFSFLLHLRIKIMLFLCTLFSSLDRYLFPLVDRITNKRDFCKWSLWFSFTPCFVHVLKCDSFGTSVNLNTCYKALTKILSLINELFF